MVLCSDCDCVGCVEVPGPNMVSCRVETPGDVSGCDLGV